MKRIRIGNDFVFNWAIERGGLPEDLSSVLDAKLTVSVFGKKQDIPFTVSGNIITVEFTPEICNIIGSYNLLFTYILPDTGLSDEERKCAVDVDAFQIVAKTAQADDSTEFSMTSDMAIAFKGDKGDSAYQVWLEEGNIGTEEDYFAYLRQPAVDAGASISELEGEIQVSEGLRVSAENERDLAEATRIQAESERLAAEIIRQSNEGTRIDNEATRVQNEAERISEENVRQSNEIDRVEAEGLRIQAENERVQAEVERQIIIQEAITATNLANEKANLANTAAQSANEAAGLADTARTELTTAVNTKLGEADAKIEEMDTTLSTYDGRVTQVESDISQLAGDVKELGIKDAVQGAKIKDIENVISTMNPNQSAQLSVSGVSPLSMPKNAANGGMSVKLEGLTAENLFVGGKLITATSYAHNSGQKIDVILGNKYYARRLYQTISGTNGTATGRVCTLSPTHEFVRASDILSRITTYDSESEYNKSIYTYGPQMDTILGEFRDVMIINLTATFGAGNEPDLETCDKMFSDYFEGKKNFIPTGRIRVEDASENEVSRFYLTAPELRSNGTVKDEIRKGANGYELVKRVGVGTLGDEMIPNGGFDTDTGWNIVGGFTIAGGVATYDGSGTGTARLSTNTSTSIVANKWYRISFDIIGEAMNCGLLTTGSGLLFGNSDVRAVRNPGRYILYLKASTTHKGIQFFALNTSITNSSLDNFSVKEITETEPIADTSTFTELSDGTILYTLATPEIIPISYGGILNSAENGTVYHEPIIADAGVYETKMDILLTDYPIATIEEIIKHENGVDTYLNVASAVVASDGLSFTHPDLTDGDLVLFTYAYDKESTNGNITATFYDSNVVKIDTVTGKAYKIEDVITDGVLTRTLTEV